MPSSAAPQGRCAMAWCWSAAPLRVGAPQPDAFSRCAWGQIHCVCAPTGARTPTPARMTQLASGFRGADSGIAQRWSAFRVCACVAAAAPQTNEQPNPKKPIAFLLAKLQPRTYLNLRHWIQICNQCKANTRMAAAYLRQLPNVHCFGCARLVKSDSPRSFVGLGRTNCMAVIPSV
eukprot:364978-Chlamydomonas_euryale.AAC.2